MLVELAHPHHAASILRCLWWLFCTAAALWPGETSALANNPTPANTAPAADTDAHQPDRLRVATLNLRNYLLMDRYIDGAYRRDYPKPEPETAAIRQILLLHQPDILALQEIGEEPFLRELQRDLNAAGLHYPHAVWMQAADTKRHLAVLSRLPPESVHRHPDIDFPYLGERLKVKRGLLELRFAPPQSLPWALYVVHLKSRLTEHPEDPQAELRRTREAQALRDFIRQHPDATRPPAFLIAGDFNDGPQSATLRRFLTVSDNTLTHMIPAEDSRAEVWTYHNAPNGTYARIDYFLASPSILPFIHRQSARIADEPPMRIASDHRLLFLDLLLPLANTRP